MTKGAITTNGNGFIQWSLTIRKRCGDGDDGSRSNSLKS